MKETAEYRTAAEADRAIRRLPVRLRSSPLVPGGGLEAHEGNASHRGHTIRKHVKKTQVELAQRILLEPDLQLSSSFTDRHTAEAAIAKVLDQRKHAVDEWLGTRKKGLVLEADCDYRLGIALRPDGRMVTPTRVRVVLRKEASLLGYYIKSAFPTP